MHLLQQIYFRNEFIQFQLTVNVVALAINFVVAVLACEFPLIEEFITVNELCVPF